MKNFNPFVVCLMEALLVSKKIKHHETRRHDLKGFRARLKRNHNQGHKRV